ncbi:MAG: hypothetical protein MPJ50_08365 [Pirellulales bacterium]|nr:hypothetical protein [Pirellulales bacterium]
MPSSNGRLAIAFLVVAAGAALAWAFRQPDSAVEQSSNISRGIVYRESPPPPVPTAHLSVRNPLPGTSTEEASLPSAEPAHMQRTFAAASSDGLINVVPRSREVHGGDAIAHTARRIPPISAGASGSINQPVLSANPPQPPDMNGFRATRARKHLIADGDTLADLAELYLGDAGRAEEIFEHNRDQLPAADVLPLGATIVIPAR